MLKTSYASFVCLILNLTHCRFRHFIKKSFKIIKTWEICLLYFFFQIIFQNFVVRTVFYWNFVVEDAFLKFHYWSFFVKICFLLNFCLCLRKNFFWKLFFWKLFVLKSLWNFFTVYVFVFLICRFLIELISCWISEYKEKFFY